MIRSVRKQANAARYGVILLVVISMLVLFSLVGVAFVVYAEGQANTARIWREGETLQHPDMDPELLMAYFLSQLIYDTDNPNSAIRSHSLSRNMYGRPGSYVPFNGTGRVHTAAAEAADDFYKVDYTNYPGNGGRNPDQYGSPNPPYTYPDFNHLYLATQKAGTGEILIPSFSRFRPDGTPVSLRPDRNYHSNFPALTSRSGDVKNLADGPGFNNGPNDSIWIDLGFPVMVAPDGRKFKALFAPLVLDLDNRLNVNVHGNIRGSTNGNIGGGVDPREGRSLSDQGFGPWEVNPKWVIPATDGLDPNTPGTHWECRRLFIGNLDSNWNQSIKGRYEIKKPGGPARGAWGEDWHRLPEQYAIKGPFYSPTNGDANFPGMGVRFPGFGAPPSSSFPYYTGNFDGWLYGNACRNHPLLYNFFMPSNSYYNPATTGRHFAVSNMEALLRYGDGGSPALTSELFVLCPQSFGDPVGGGKTRRLCTTHTFDVDQPGVMPWLWTPPGGTPLRLAAGDPYPTAAPLPFPPTGSSPSGEFSAAWQSVSAGFGRINLNRDLPKGSLPWYVGVSGYGPPSFPAGLTNGRITDVAAFDAAITARQQFASELFFCLRWIVGAADPATATPGTPEFDALRWLAQLCANMVDMIDTDDCMTPFQWTPGHWVFGTELPRLVINEAYMEIANDPADPKTGGRATRDYKVNCWAELLNPFFDGGGQGGQGGALRLTEDARARLWVPAGANGQPGYAAYRVIIGTPDPALRRLDNVRGDPDPARIKTVVADFTPEPTDATTNQPPPPTLIGDEINIVRPLGTGTSGTNGGNTGFYVLGPKADYPGKDANRPKASLRVKDQQVNGQRSSMVYEYPVRDAAGAVQDPANVGRHMLLLQRLACPYMPPQTDPALPRYNPYITVDTTVVPVNDGVDADTTGARAAATPVDQRYSMGRNQPYAGHATQGVQQKPLTALVDQPQTTLFKLNIQATDPATSKGKTDPPNLNFPYDWLTFIDRPLVSPIELLMTSAYKPHELTQQFMQGAPDPVTAKPPSRFQHMAPWFDDNARIFRLYEFLSATSPMQWVPVGGRATGRMNINTMWDPEIFNALGDKAPNHFYTQADIDSFFAKMLASRSPTGRPGANDRPFRGMAVPITPATLADPQYPQGIGIEDTMLRSDPADPQANPALKRRLFEPAVLNNNANGHPYIKYEFLKKVFNSFTTRSNVFAVWVTAGFFEVQDNGASGGPPRLGPEINFANNRHVRHRMFAIVDRTNVTIGFDPANGSLIPGQHGDRPFFLPSHSRVPGAGVHTIDVPGINGVYEFNPWSIKANDYLVVDSGQNQEIVQVMEARALNPGVDPPANKGPYVIRAAFAKPHVSRFAISNAVLGNPGPQPRFDIRHPSYQGVVRFFSIVE